MKRKSKADVLGRDFADLIDEKDQDELVRRQLLEITEGQITEGQITAEPKSQRTAASGEPDTT
ncbi:MAG: hypothetical protein V3S41_06955, partial [Spirochaetia bacterium]